MRRNAIGVTSDRSDSSAAAARAEDRPSLLPSTGPGSTAVRLADEAAAVACRMGRPAAGNAPAENRRTQHGAFETGAAVDVATGHACDLTGGVERADRLEMLVEHATLEVGLGAAEVLARQREDLNGIVGWRVERLRRLERLAEFRLPLEPLLA